jgi:hypothetical protein
MLRVPADGSRDEYAASRLPAVWPLDETVYVVIAGRRFLNARPNLDPVECRILEASTLEEAQEIVTPHRAGRPGLKVLRRLANKLARIPEASPEERAFFAAIEYATTGVVKDWPGRIASMKEPT